MKNTRFSVTLQIDPYLVWRRLSWRHLWFLQTKDVKCSSRWHAFVKWYKQNWYNTYGLSDKFYCVRFFLSGISYFCCYKIIISAMKALHRDSNMYISKKKITLFLLTLRPNSYFESARVQITTMNGITSATMQNVVQFCQKLFSAFWP